MESQLVNDKLRAFTSKVSKSEPATWKNYITTYHKDNYEPERVRHVQFLSHDDPHMTHGLPQDLDDKTLEPVNKHWESIELKLIIIKKWIINNNKYTIIIMIPKILNFILEIIL